MTSAGFGPDSISSPFVLCHERPVVSQDTNDAKISDERDAALRQLPVQRLVGYGVDYGDALTLRNLVERGAAWPEAATAIASQLSSRITVTGVLPSTSTRRNLLLRASALLRASQIMMLHDSAERMGIYGRASDLFRQAFEPGDRLQRKHIDVEGRTMVGWFYESEYGAGAPGVLIIGGIEGWAMDLLGLGDALVARGVSVLLLDGPGQGETRFVHRHFLDDAWPRTLSTAVSYLSRLIGDRPVGVLGNSVGGGFAMKLAASDHRISACCNNGALFKPLSQRQRRGFFPKMEAFCGNVPDDHIDKIWSTVEITPDVMKISCPLLILQGGLDPLVSISESEQMLNWASSTDKQMHVFVDGDHCIYNRASDKYNIVGDWFADRLKVRSPA